MSGEVKLMPSPIERLAEHLAARPMPPGDDIYRVADWLEYSLNRCGLVVVEEQSLTRPTVVTDEVVEPLDAGVPASPSGCQPAASAAEEASSQSGIPNAGELLESWLYLHKWVERGLFCSHTDAKTALQAIAYHPSAPWNNGRWDVDHKPYASKFYRAFPKAIAAMAPE